MRCEKISLKVAVALRSEKDSARPKCACTLVKAPPLESLTARSCQTDARVCRLGRLPTLLGRRRVGRRPSRRTRVCLARSRAVNDPSGALTEVACTRVLGKRSLSHYARLPRRFLGRSSRIAPRYT